VPIDPRGWPAAERGAFRRDQRETIAVIGREIDWLLSAPLPGVINSYLAVSLRCAYPASTHDSGAAGVQMPPPDILPILAYRLATCGDVDTAALEDVRARVPAFVETSYFLGADALAGIRSGGGSRAREWIDEAYGAFRSSPGVVLLAAEYQTTIGDPGAALRLYDEALARTPAHEDAHLGRLVALTLLERPDDAIAEATTMIDRTYLVDQALYWRALNRRAQHDLDLAREDVDRARILRFTGDVATLAGLIEHDRGELDEAQRDLQTALQMSGGDRNCTAAWFLGSVFAKRSAWTDAGDRFVDAMGCYERERDEHRAALVALARTPDLDPAYKTGRSAALHRELAAAERERAAAALNAGNCLALGGSTTRAAALLDTAAEDPSLADSIAVIRDYLGRRGGS
jgi:tetratricopeptide (TPR) repeat protein